MKILVIDDSQTARFAICNIIKRLCQECEIVESENGKDAFSLLKTHSFNHIFTDLNMGDDASGGFAFIHKLLGNKILAKKKITIISSSISIGIKKSMSKYDNINFIEKQSPIEMEIGIKLALGK
jgi:CheY-like chemotaxis protein